ncbi:MAG: DAK2 domain-containing protein [Dehalococcoidales bacterium]|nr:DAK2 domain-containing protein [Dehalococcoidales bacterium]
MVRIMDRNMNQERQNHQYIDGRTFREMFTFAVDWFAKSESDVNILNVFPVPDGDTGTNMLLTMRSSLEEIASSDHLHSATVSAISQSMAYGALMGARGNSGVILCQIWRGIAGSLAEKQILCGADLAEAFNCAARTAYEGIENPVEGTILTVIKEVAAATSKFAEQSEATVTRVMEIAVETAATAVANTPNLLPVLKEAGVVDSGGQGLYILLEGALMYLTDQTIRLQTGKSRIIEAVLEDGNAVEIKSEEGPEEEIPFGYCTEFLLKGHDLYQDAIRNHIRDMGQSLIVTGNQSVVKIHIHCQDPSPVIHYALSLGTISAVSIRNMDEQNMDLRKLIESRKIPVREVSVVAIATGEGIIQAFNNLGVAAIVPGGPTMNPSTKQVLEAVESVASDKVIILPDDKNLLLVAQQVSELTSKEVGVVPAVTIPQGIAAMLSYDPDADLKSNLEAMQESRSMVKTLEITRAIRATKINGFSIQSGQALALLDGKILAVDDDIKNLISGILDRIGLAEAETVSIYYGADIELPAAREIRDMMYQINDKLNIDVACGGQPLYHYIISIE